MAEDQSIDRGELLALTAEIVAAHVGNNAVAGAEVGADPVGLRYAAWPGDGRAGSVGRADTGSAHPPLGDRRPHRLPRGRQEAEDVEAAPDDRPWADAGGYRAKWGLRPDYPMVAPTYSVQRRRSQSRSAWGAEPAPPPPPARPEPEKPKRRRKTEA